MAILSLSAREPRVIMTQALRRALEALVTGDR